MTAHEFDELVARLQDAGNRRKAIKGVLGGALLSLGGVAAIDAKQKRRYEKRQARRDVGSETNAVGNGKRIACSCTGTTNVTCETVRVKPKKLKKILKHPDSHRGACEDLAGTSTSTTSTSTSTSTTTTTTTTTTSTTPIP